ncbi:MAG: alginate export family protein [Nitrospirota bacterium]
MSKYLAIFLGVLLILSFSATAFAVHETPPGEEAPVIAMGSERITLGGKIITKGWYLNDIASAGNFVFLPDEDADSASFYHSNVYLQVDAQVTDNLRALVEIETASGTSLNSGLYFWGGTGTSNPASSGYDTKPDTHLRLRQAWIQYTGSGLLGIPAGIKIGHMPISLGEKQFLNNERFGDDAILVWIDPTKELHIVAGLTKLNEEDRFSQTDDLDGYVLLATYTLNKDHTIGANWLWAHSNGNCPSLGTGTNVDELNFHNVGIHANGSIAGLKYAAEADFQFGEAEDVAFSGDDLEAEGWAVFAKLSYMIDPINIRASFAYGSGDDDADDESCEEFQTLQGPDYDITARLVHYTQIYERTIRTAANSAILTTKEGGNVMNTNIANTTYYNLGIDVTPLKDLSVSLDGFLLYATDTGAWEDDVGQSVDDELGWEIDAKLSWKIAKNFVYFVEAGLFDPGDFYKDAFGADTDNVTQVIHGVSLSF